MTSSFRSETCGYCKILNSEIWRVCVRLHFRLFRQHFAIWLETVWYAPGAWFNTSGRARHRYTIIVVGFSWRYDFFFQLEWHGASVNENHEFSHVNLFSFHVSSFATGTWSLLWVNEWQALKACLNKCGRERQLYTIIVVCCFLLNFPIFNEGELKVVWFLSPGKTRMSVLWKRVVSFERWSFLLFRYRLFRQQIQVCFQKPRDKRRRRGLIKQVGIDKVLRS